jgi:hypothetical protein
LDFFINPYSSIYTIYAQNNIPTQCYSQPLLLMREVQRYNGGKRYQLMVPSPLWHLSKHHAFGIPPTLLRPKTNNNRAIEDIKG